MQPAWTTADLLPYVCGHITDVHCLAALSAVNRSINQYLFSVNGGKHWVSAGKVVCGDDYWPKDDESVRLEDTDPRYLTKIRICPWISEPADEQRYDLEFPRWGDLNDRDTQIVNRLNWQRWAPSHGQDYGPIRIIIKIHDGAFLATANTIVLNRSFAYVVSSKDFRLLRDRFYIAETGNFEVWMMFENSLYLALRPRNQAVRLRPKILRFGIRQDKALSPMPPPEHKATVIQAFWSAFRGDMHEALHTITAALGSDIDLSALTCHDQTLAEHVVAGGSLGALRALLQAEPRCVNRLSTMLGALHAGRYDMATLIASKLDPAAMHPKSSLWRMLTEEGLTVEGEKGIDINVLCIQYCHDWLRDDNKEAIPPYLSILCSICAQRELAEIMQRYCSLHTDGLTDDHKAKMILELLSAHEVSK